jgi:hypothetical protein
MDERNAPRIPGAPAAAVDRDRCDGVMLDLRVVADVREMLR